MTAQRTAADTDTTENLRLISHTDLTQFDTCLEDRCQIFYQFPEIDSSVCGKIKQDLVIVINSCYDFNLRIFFTQI